MINWVNFKKQPPTIPGEYLICAVDKQVFFTEWNGSEWTFNEYLTSWRSNNQIQYWAKVFLPEQINPCTPEILT